MITVFKEFKFSAAHHLCIDGHPCSKIHGHNYLLRVEVTGCVDETGMVIDFHDIKRIVSPLVEQLDHSMLNDHIETTTSEGICLWFAKKISIPGLSKIEIRETESCGAFLVIEEST